MTCEYERKQPAERAVKAAAAPSRRSLSASGRQRSGQQQKEFGNYLLFSRINMRIKNISFWIVIISFLTGCSTMKKTYEKEKKELLELNKSCEIKVFSEELVKDLPEQIKKYLSVCGYMNTPVPINADVHWSESYIKLKPEKEWGELQTTQFNSVNPVARISFMRFLSMPVHARDIYRNGYGEMNGKLFNLFKVVFDNSKETAQSVLGTTFCEFLVIPGYILSANVEWESLSENSVRATLTDNEFVISGIFHFDEEGLFRHFETNDRNYYVGKNDYKKVKFSVFIDSYKNQGDIQIAERVKVMWHFPEGDFEYFKGVIDKMEFNVFE